MSISYTHYNTFDPRVLNLKGDYYLDGYLQSYKYFEKINEILRKDFTFKNPLDIKNSIILKKFKKVIRLVFMLEEVIS